MKKIFVFIVAAVLTLQTVQATEGFLERDDLRKIGHDTSKFVLEKPLQNKEHIITQGSIFILGTIAFISAGFALNYLCKIATLENSNKADLKRLQLPALLWTGFSIFSIFYTKNAKDKRTKQLKTYKKQKKALRKSNSFNFTQVTVRS